MKDILKGLTVITVLAVRALPTGPNTCTSWCVSDKLKRCSESVPCTIEEEFSPPLLEEGKELEVTLECFEYNKTKYGLLIMWIIQGVSLRNIDKFYINIQDIKGVNIISNTDVGISFNQNLAENKLVKFQYAYFSEDEGSSVVIRSDLKYDVSIQTLSNESNVFQGNSQTWKGFCSKTQSTEISTTHPNTIVNSTEPNSPHSNSLVFTLLLIFVALIFIISCAAVFAKKRCFKSYVGLRLYHSVGKHPNILILNPMDARNPEFLSIERDLVQYATALRQSSEFGDVIYNKWHEQEIGDLGLPGWLREKINWAQKIVYTSIPANSIENEQNYQAFNNALDFAYFNKIQHGENKKIIIVTFEQFQQDWRCPYWNNVNYENFALPSQWEDLCRCLVAREEETPLLIR